MVRIALVTGGTRGIGRAIAIALKADGCDVAAVYRGNDEAAKQLKDMAAKVREALPESPRLEFLALVYGMLFVTVGGLLAIYFVDRKNARHNQ